jgi:hypothetical protein
MAKKSKTSNIEVFKLGQNTQSEPTSKIPKGSSDNPIPDKGKKEASPPDTQTALARLAVLARAGDEAGKKEEISNVSDPDPSPQSMIDDPDYIATFNILDALKGRTAKGDFSGLEIGSPGADLKAASDKIFEIAWNQAKTAVRGESKSVRVKKLLAILDEGDPTKNVIPSIAITPEEPACNFVYQNAAAPLIDAFTSKLSTSQSTNNK